MSEPTSLHPYARNKADYLYELIQKIDRQYHGDVSQIWKGEPSSAEVVRRFLEFKGFGPKLANMTANILVMEFKVAYSDYLSIDVSADRHVKQVLSRLGLVAMNPSDDQVIYTAREISPEYPALIDFPLFYIGRDYCHPNDPNCSQCPLNRYCLKLL